MAKQSRTDEPREIVKTTPPPEYLARLAEQDDSLAELSQKRVLARIGIVQGSSAVELKQNFGEGAAILKPVNIGLVGPGESFKFVPLFFFTEYCVWSDIADKNSPRIFERTFDPNSIIARRSGDREKRFEEYPGGPKEKPFRKRYVEHLNFAGYVYDGEIKGTPVVLGFSRGEYGTGQNYITAITMRRIAPGKSAPLFAQVWQLKTASRTRNGNNWWGFDYAPPTDGQLFVTEEEAESFRAEHLSLKEAHAKKALIVDQTDADDEFDDAPTGSEETGSKKF